MHVVGTLLIQVRRRVAFHALAHPCLHPAQYAHSQCLDAVCFHLQGQERPFNQTFFLATQENGFYVHNDMLRVYPATSVPLSNGDHKEPPAALPRAVPVSALVVQDAYGGRPMGARLAAPCSSIGSKSELCCAHPQAPTAQPPAAAPPQKAAPAPAQKPPRSQAASPAPPPAAPTPPPAATPQQAPSPGPTARPPSAQAEAAPAQPSPSPASSWAALVKHPQTAAPTKTPPSTPAPAPTPANVDSQPAPQPQANGNIPHAAHGRSQSTDSGAAARPGTTYTSGPVHSHTVVIRNLPNEHLAMELFEEVFAQFGPLRKGPGAVTIHNMGREHGKLAYIKYEDASGVEAAVKATGVKILDRVVEVAKFDGPLPNYQTRGGPGRGGFRGGRTGMGGPPGRGEVIQVHTPYIHCSPEVALVQA